MEQIIEQLNDYMSRTGASQTKVAKALGISPATLSYFLKRNYTGDIDSICDKAKDFLDTEAERAKFKTNDGIVQTSAFKTIQAAVDFAMKRWAIGSRNVDIMLVANMCRLHRRPYLRGSFRPERHRRAGACLRGGHLPPGCRAGRPGPVLR